MLKLLVKKQLSEIFRVYFYDAKKNKARSKVSTIMFMLWFAVIMIGVLGGIFTMLSRKLCAPMAALDMGWMYFALMGLIAILLGTFGSVFNTFSGLYLAKDNDLLLSMPIPVSAIVASRLVSVYIMGLMYSAVVIIPAWIVYMVTAGVNIKNLFGGMILTLLISVFVMTLSCLLGYVVAKVSLKLKHKSMITVLVSLIFIGGYYFVYFKAQSMITDLLTNLVVYGDKIKGSAYLFFAFGSVGVGDAKATLIMLALVAVTFLMMWFLISKSFLQVATSTGKVSKVVYHKKTMKQESVTKALLFREFKHFTSSPGYMLNSGLGIFLMPICAVALLWKGRKIFIMLNGMFGGQDGSVLLLVTIMLCGLTSMDIMTAPSISLEGKSLWIVQSLPVTPWQVLRAKLDMQLILNSIPVMLCMICTAVVCPFKIGQFVMMILQVLSFVFVMAVFGLFMGVIKPVLTWTNELAPIKQSASVMITMFGGFGYTALLFIGYMMLPGYTLGYMLYIGIFIAVNVVAGLTLYIWLKTKGCDRFAEL